ncbi:hypothetical protein GUITHDRAFT_156623, partial [Guillardia theta CCMP2712]
MQGGRGAASGVLMVAASCLISQRDPPPLLPFLASRRLSPLPLLFFPSPPHLPCHNPRFTLRGGDSEENGWEEVSEEQANEFLVDEDNEGWAGRSFEGNIRYKVLEDVNASQPGGAGRGWKKPKMGDLVVVTCRRLDEKCKGEH